MQSVDPAQTPRSAASDLGLHCLPMSLLWDARHKWVELLYSALGGLCSVTVVPNVPSYPSLHCFSGHNRQFRDNTPLSIQ